MSNIDLPDVLYTWCMKLVTWNVNGIRGLHAKDLFQQIFQFAADVYCLQETKSELSQLPDGLQNIKGYHVVYSHSRKRKGYSGTAIYTKEKPLNVILDIPNDIAKKYSLEDSYGHPNEEGRVIAVELEKYFVVNVYTPNSKPDLSRVNLRENAWDPAFLEFCKSLEKTKPVIFCGDLNVAHTPDDLANPAANTHTHGFTAEERAGIDKIIASGFTDAFRLFTQGNGHYTWWSHFAKARERNVGWRIDYFFVSRSIEKNVKSCTIRADIKGSDHCPVILEIK
ncbi:MAG: Exodeoxyribonuclease [Patescibacteria group bacterium]|nr:Exodeoxyribonuclease [Patescibacteria group bacterium]